MNIFMRMWLGFWYPNVCWKHRRVLTMFYGYLECSDCRQKGVDERRKLFAKWAVK